MTNSENTAIGQSGDRIDSRAADGAHRLIVATPDGVKRVINGADGLTVMEIIRDAGIDALPALCGGGCSCATCHVHVASEWFDRLPAMGEDEDMLLDGAVDRTGLSRLSCQIPFSAALSGIELAIARME